MSWDPITRIVGSLGIHTKIDFENRRVAECHSTSSIFRGYSVFMKGKDPRDAHFITSRICGICGDNHATCAVYAQNMAFGVKPPPLAEWIINLGEAAEYMFDHNLFQDNLVGVDFCEQMVQETNPGRAGRGGENRGAARRACMATAPSPTSCARSIRSPARLSRSAADEPAHARDVLPDGRPARASLDALSRRRRHRAQRPALQRLSGAAAEIHRVHEKVRAAARRSFRLLLRGAAGLRRGRPAAHDARLLGLIQQSRRLRFPLRDHDRWGRAMFVTPGHRRRWQTAHDRSRRYQSRHPHSARQFLLRRLARRRDLRHARSARQSGRSAASLEPDHDPEAAEARFQRKYTWVMSPRWHDQRTGDHLALDTGGGPLARFWVTALAGTVDIGGTSKRPATVSKSSLPKTANLPRRNSSGRSRNGATRSNATAPAPISRPMRRRRRSISSSRRSKEVHAGRIKTWNEFKVPEEAIGCGFHEAVRGVLSHHVVIRDGKIANYHPYPPTPWNASPRDSSARPALTRTRCRIRPSSRKTAPTNSRGSTSCAPCGALIRACPAASICTSATAS